VKQKKYEYEKCPLDDLPPMDHRTFLHYMNEHDGNGAQNHSDAQWLPRLPKKMGPSILLGRPSEIPFGWGVHIIEGPNKQVMALATCLGLLVVFLLSLMYAVVAKTEEQGFGIGAFFVAELTVGITAMYYHAMET